MRESPRRDRIEIATEVLKKAKSGIKKTNIMYRCNLSPKQNEEYLQALLGSGFLELHPTVNTQLLMKEEMLLK